MAHFSADLWRTDPRIAGSGHRGNGIASQRGWVQRRKDGPILPCYEREICPVQPAEGESQTREIHIDAIAERRLASKEIHFHLAANLCAHYVRDVKKQSEPG